MAWTFFFGGDFAVVVEENCERVVVLFYSHTLYNEVIHFYHERFMKWRHRRTDGPTNIFSYRAKAVQSRILKMPIPTLPPN